LRFPVRREDRRRAIETRFDANLMKPVTPGLLDDAIVDAKTRSRGEHEPRAA
jgi:hypothetical protein